MVKQGSLQANTFVKFEEPLFAADDFDLLQEQRISVGVINPEQPSPPTCTCLNLENLKCFEAVEHQYQKWGIVFDNCIAIQPSNPAFPTHSGSVVLMGAPKGGFLEASFAHPVSTVSAYVTSSQRLVLSAYNCDRQIIAQTVLPGANLANSDSAVPPNKRLCIEAEGICSVSLCAFDGQFTVDDFTFCG
jgi:hypothetical protein